MKTKVDIISGFLGAGKTTLIKKMLEEKLYDEKLVIIENEFGEIGIDGSILKKSGVEVKEMNSGCICCTLVGDFGKAIQEVITKFKPDRIVIEPSGVGKLSDVIKACEMPKLKELLQINMVITVADVQKYQMYASNFGEFFENQIKNAKTVILSRTQKVDSKKTEAVVQAIRKCNGKANVITTPWENLSAACIIDAAEQVASAALENEIKRVILKKQSHAPGCKCGCNHHHSHSHSADEVFSVWSTETPRVYEEKDLKSILHALGNHKVYGMVLRGKGFLQIGQDQWAQFDYVPEEFDIKTAGADYTGRVCFIGRDLNKDELSRLFQVTA